MPTSSEMTWFQTAESSVYAILSLIGINCLIACAMVVAFTVLFLLLDGNDSGSKNKYADSHAKTTESRNFKYKRAALVTFIGLPLLVYCLWAVALRTKQLVPVARVAFLYIVIILPPALFILFIATRRESLFNQYVANLDRLGLLRRRRLAIQEKSSSLPIVEDDLSLMRRVRSYLDRFSAVYGTLPIATTNLVIQGVVKPLAEAEPKAEQVTAEAFSSFELKTILPVFGAGMLIAIGWITTLPPYPPVAPGPEVVIFEPATMNNVWYFWGAEPVLSPVNFAFLGAYFFSLQMLVKRFMRRDLGPNAYNAVSVRIILATLAVWVTMQYLRYAFGAKISTISQRETAILLVTSFAVGAFPLIVWQLVANILKRIPGAYLALPNLEGTQPLSQIDGLSVWHEARLEEEDIENVPNLATADIVDLMLNTKMSPSRIIDWVDQALFISVLPPEPKESRQLPKKQPGTGDCQKSWISDRLEDYGIRSASSLVKAEMLMRDNALSILTSFTADEQAQVRGLALAVKQYPNYLLITSWLSVEPSYLPDQTGRTIPPAT